MDRIIYGIHSINSLIKINIFYIKKIYFNQYTYNKRILNLIKLIKKYNIPILYTNKKIIDKKTLTSCNQGIMAIINKYIPYNDSYLKKYKFNKNSLILILDKITDPHNLGACLRTALSCNVNLIIISKFNTCNLNNPIITKVACGALEYIPIVLVNNIIKTINILKLYNIWVLGTIIDNKQSNCLFKCNFCNNGVAIIMGSEELGLSKLIIKSCDELIHIPMIHKYSNSLNVSVATGIILYEILRQKLYK